MKEKQNDYPQESNSSKWVNMMGRLRRLLHKHLILLKNN